MEDRLKVIADSYDQAIAYGKKGIDLYQDLPTSITGDPDYPLYQKLLADGSISGSGSEWIRAYLAPATTMHFVDLGCNLNLMFRGYDTWPSTYYGVDISHDTVELLRQFAKDRGLAVGALHCGSIHELPFGNNSFDIGACIGVLEYFERGFVRDALREAHRVLKPNGRFALDIPNLGTPACRIEMMIEAHLGRPVQFDMMTDEFDRMLKEYFNIDHQEVVDAGAMRVYSLRCNK